jgi:hypothetical protein
MSGNIFPLQRGKWQIPPSSFFNFNICDLGDLTQIMMDHFLINITLKKSLSQVLVAQSCNPSYTGDRDQEDCGLKPAQEKI